MRKFLFCSALTLLIANAQTHERIAGHALSMQGLGPIRIGMSVADFRRLGLAMEAGYPPSNDPDSRFCNQAALARFPGISVMFENGTLTRIDIDSGNVKSVDGVGIGTTEKDAKKIYGERLVIEPNFYDAASHDLKVFSADGRYGMLFETDGKEVTGFRSGLNKSVQYVEGCE